MRGSKPRLETDKMKKYINGIWSKRDHVKHIYFFEQKKKETFGFYATNSCIDSLFSIFYTLYLIFLNKELIFFSWNQFSFVIIIEAFPPATRKLDLRAAAR